MEVSENCSEDVNGNVVPMHAAKYFGGGGAEDAGLVILNLDSRWRSVVLCPGRFTPRDGVPCNHWMEHWVGPRTGLGALERKETLG